MLPFIINQGSFVIPTFFFMTMLGVLATTFYLYFRAPKLGFSQIVVLDVGILGAIFGILGARLFHVFFEALWFYKEDPMRFFEFGRGGFVSFGAYIGGAVAVLTYLKIKKVPILKYADFIATAIPIMVVAIRLGCIGAGCCYGKPTDFFLHFIFTNPHSDAGSKFPGVPLHATQLYDILNGIFIFSVLHWRYARKKFDGEIFLIFFMMYATIRGLIEIMRGDLDRGVYLDGIISTGQITGLLMVLGAAVAYFILWKKSRTSRR